MLVFGKYETNEVQLADSTLGNYINLETKKFPHTFGRLAKKRFSKDALLMDFWGKPLHLDWAAINRQ